MPLIMKSVQHREGRVAEVRDIPALVKPNKNIMHKSQSMAKMGSPETITQGSLKDMMAQYDKF